MPKPAIVVSDVHLGAVPRATERAFREFLDFAAGNASELVVNGDLFDFWFEYRTVVLREHYRVVARLADVVEAGLPVTFIGGNHDAWTGDFLEEEVGIRVLRGPVETTVAGRKALVAHGDGLGKGDLKYRALRAVIRHPVSIRAFRALHPDFGMRMAMLASTTEHKADTGDAAARGRARFIEEWAAEQLGGTTDVEMVLAGHAHVPSVSEVAPGRFYANSGDWIRHFTYLVVHPEPGTPPELRRWPVKGE